MESYDVRIKTRKWKGLSGHGQIAFQRPVIKLANTESLKQHINKESFTQVPTKNISRIGQPEEGGGE
jgi:hypothetical protein